MKKAIASYELDGEIYSIRFPADTLAEARCRVDAMRRSLRLDGYPSFSVPGILPHWMVAFWARALNWRSGR